MKTRPPLKKARDAFRSHGGILRTAQVMSLGIHPRTLYAMRDGGELVELSRGLFRLSKMPDMKAPDLATISARIPTSVICLISALSFHEITTQIPHRVDIALPRGFHAPRLRHPPIKVFRYADKTFKEGVEVHRIDGVDVRIFNAARTVADCFKFRNRIGIDVAVEALKLCLTRKKARPAQIMEQARICRVARIIKPYMEAML
jgi:predicted transcriptional regulator of viral defense system